MNEFSSWFIFVLFIRVSQVDRNKHSAVMEPPHWLFNVIRNGVRLLSTVINWPRTTRANSRAQRTFAHILAISAVEDTPTPARNPVHRQPTHWALWFVSVIPSANTLAVNKISTLFSDAIFYFCCVNCPYYFAMCVLVWAWLLHYITWFTMLKYFVASKMLDVKQARARKKKFRRKDNQFGARS